MSVHAKLAGVNRLMPIGTRGGDNPLYDSYNRQIPTYHGMGRLLGCGTVAHRMRRLQVR